MAHKFSKLKKRSATTVAPQKARKILRDGSVRGRPLTKRQRGFFGARLK